MKLHEEFKEYETLWDTLGDQHAADGAAGMIVSLE